MKIKINGTLSSPFGNRVAVNVRCSQAVGVDLVVQGKFVSVYDNVRFRGYVESPDLTNGKGGFWKRPK